MSNPYYPPGVTDRDIDNQFGGATEDWPFALVCDHENMENPPPQSVFDADEVNDLSVWNSGYDRTSCEWTCPICDEVHTEEIGPDDYFDDNYGNDE